jgi:hypothetical protein
VGLFMLLYYNRYVEASLQGYSKGSLGPVMQI